MLRLAAGTPMMQDQHPRGLAHGFDAKIPFHEAQRQVQRGRHAGGCPDRPVGYEDPINLHRRLRISALKLLGARPVGRRPAAIEQSGLAQDESSDADRRDSAGVRGRAA